MHKHSPTGSISAVQKILEEWEAFCSHVRSEPVRAFLAIAYLFSGASKLVAPRTLQATFQHGHPLWLWRVAGMMELGVVHGLLCKHPQEAAILSYTFLGGVLYTVAVFPQDLPVFLKQAHPVLASLVRAVTFVPSLAFVALTAYCQKSPFNKDEYSHWQGHSWSKPDWQRSVSRSMFGGLTIGALGAHVLSFKNVAN